MFLNFQLKRTLSDKTDSEPVEPGTETFEATFRVPMIPETETRNGIETYETTTVEEDINSTYATARKDELKKSTEKALGELVNDIMQYAGPLLLKGQDLYLVCRLDAQTGWRATASGDKSGKEVLAQGEASDDESGKDVLAQGEASDGVKGVKGALTRLVVNLEAKHQVPA